MNKERNRSKSKRISGPYSTALPTRTAAEREIARKDRADRIAATKKNSRRKKLKAKYAKPKETPELKAAQALQAKEAARKLFEKWLDGPAVTKFLAENKNQRHYGLTWWLKGWLSDLGTDMNAEP